MAEVRATGGRKRMNGVNHDLGRSIYRGPLELPVVIPVGGISESQRHR
jgi:hypothetical protein